MHELGLVEHIVRTLEDLAVEQQLTEVRLVTLEIGEVSSVLPDYLMDCWNYFHVKSKLLKNAKLHIERPEAISICEDCGRTYATLEYKKQCPYCKGYFTHLVSGNEFNIKYGVC